MAIEDALRQIEKERWKKVDYSVNKLGKLIEQAGIHHNESLDAIKQALEKPRVMLPYSEASTPASTNWYQIAYHDLNLVAVAWYEIGQGWYSDSYLSREIETPDFFLAIQSTPRIPEGKS